MRKQYVALMRSGFGSDYGVSFPDLPGCITAGKTLDEARILAEEALELHLEGLAEDGDAIPEPSSFETIIADPENRDAVAILVAAPKHLRKSIRVNITLPEDVLEEIDRFAERHGYSRSGMLAHAARKLMESEKV